MSNFAVKATPSLHDSYVDIEVKHEGKVIAEMTVFAGRAVYVTNAEIVSIDRRLIESVHDKRVRTPEGDKIWHDVVFKDTKVPSKKQPAIIVCD